MVVGKCLTFVKEKSHYLMNTFIILQGLILIVLCITQFLVKGDLMELNIFGSIILFVFYMYMVHFAYHSIAKAYYIELLGFLVMSTVSSIIAVIAIFYIAIGDQSDPEKKNEFLFVFGIIASIILIIGNIIYFITAYFSYEYFEEKFYEKLGAKVKYHKMFYWVQFNNSVMKSDFGFYLIIICGEAIFNYKEYVYLIADVVLFSVLFYMIFLMRKAIRNEFKLTIILINVYKGLVIGYAGFRIYELAEPIYDLFSKISDTKILKPIFTWCVVAILITHFILIIISSWKCISFFSMGLKDALLSQTNKVFVKRESEEEERDFEIQ